MTETTSTDTAPAPQYPHLILFFVNQDAVLDTFNFASREAMVEFVRAQLDSGAWDEEDLDACTIGLAPQYAPEPLRLDGTADDAPAAAQISFTLAMRQQMTIRVPEPFDSVKLTPSVAAAVAEAALQAWIASDLQGNDAEETRGTYMNALHTKLVDSTISDVLVDAGCAAFGMLWSDMAQQTEVSASHAYVLLPPATLQMADVERTPRGLTRSGMFATLVQRSDDGLLHWHVRFGEDVIMAFMTTADGFGVRDADGQTQVTFTGQDDTVLGAMDRAGNYDIIGWR